ncbi:MAG: O-methyltransferase [Promethearchaeota archaeon]
MFHNISEDIRNRMKYLEEIDNRDRNDGTPRFKRLRQVTSETGKFLSILAASAPRGEFIEIGTSAGYSTLWIALACKLVGNKIITFETLKEKVELAKETFRITNMEKFVDLVEGDAREFIKRYKKISFCFLDAEKKFTENAMI